MPKVTLKSVAQAASVGSATVERVLNGRGGVRPETVEKVLAAARKLDYPKRVPELHRGVTRIEVMLTRPELSFLARLSKSFERIAATLHPTICVHRTFLDEGNPLDIAKRITNPTTRRSALIVVLPHHPAIRDALLRVQAQGLPVIQVSTRLQDFSSSYIGIDNQAAGRMAGLMMAGLQRKAGTVIALCHSQMYGVHRDRLRGFSDYMSKPQADHLRFEYAAFTRDDDQEAARIVSNYLRNAHDIVGVYSSGGDYGPLCDVLRRRQTGKDVCVIGHELTEQSGAALKEGIISAVIDQAPETQARRALDTALHHLGLLHTPLDKSHIRFVTITAENL